MENPSQNGQIASILVTKRAFQQSELDQAGLQDATRFFVGLDGRKIPSRSVETSIKFHSAVVDSFARCFHWDRGLSGDGDMKLKFEYYGYTVHILL